MVGWGEHKVVLDKRGFRVYYAEVDWGLNFLYEYADGIILNAMMSSQYTRDVIEHIRKGAERAGRMLSDKEVFIEDKINKS